MTKFIVKAEELNGQLFIRIPDQIVKDQSLVKEKMATLTISKKTK